MLDLDADIEPGRTLGGVPIGLPVLELLATAEPVRVVEIPGGDEDPEGVTIHSFGAIRTWSVGGVVVQVGAFEGYRGRTPEGIGLGSTIAEIGSAFGEVVATGAEGMIALPARPGLGIETTQWSSDDRPDPAARVIQLFVHGVD